MSELQQRKADRRKFSIARWSVLLLVLAVSTTIGLLHQKVPGLRIVGVDALCPFGGVESLWKLLASGGMIKKVAAGSFVLLISAVGVNLLLGRAFCGQFCPLGTLQELFSVVREKLGLRRSTVPQVVDVPARFLKYLVLGVFAWLSWLTGTLMIRPYDPWVAYHHLTSPELMTNFAIGAVILGVSLVGSFVYDRFFCKYLCPMGAFLGLFSKLGVYQVTRHADACTDCGACDRVCPANIQVSETPATLRDAECIACGECVASCPKAEALTVESGRGSVLTPVVLVGVSAAIMFGVVALSVASGRMAFFTQPLAVQAAPAVGGGAVAAPAAAAASGQSTPAFDTSLIKGYMSMAEVVQATGIPAEEFVAVFGVTEAEFSAPLKEVKAAHNWDTQAVRDFVADRLGVERSIPEGCE